MKTLPLLFISVLLLFVGCNPLCECEPTLPHFDVQGIEANHLYVNYTTNNEIEVSRYIGLHVDLKMRFIAFDKIDCKHSTSFSLVPSAMACSCPTNGWAGTKNENYEQIEILTLNHFDSIYLPGDTISELFLFDKRPLTSIKPEGFGSVQYQGFDLQLNRMPKIDSTLKFAVYLKLSNGETYQDTTEAITLAPD